MGIKLFFGLFFLMSTVVSCCYLIGQKKPKNTRYVLVCWLWGLFVWPLYIIGGLSEHGVWGKISFGSWCLAGLVSAVYLDVQTVGRFAWMAVRVLYILIYILISGVWMFAGGKLYDIFKRPAQLLHLPLPTE